MRTIMSLIFLCMMATPSVAKKTFFVKKDKKLCGKKLAVKSFAEACDKSQYFGKRVFLCKERCTKRNGLKCTKRAWRVSDAAVCNSDGKKMGFYLTRCNGSPLNATSMKKACALSQAKGKTVVQCKHGVEIKRRACSSTKNNDEKGMTTGIFVDKCGKELAQKAKKNGRWLSLKKACKHGDYSGASLVRCRNECSKRKGLKCTRWTWKEQKRVTCNDAGKTVRLVRCNESEAREISEARVNAAKGVGTIINGMKKYLADSDGYYAKNGDPSTRSQTLKKRDKDWVRRALEIAEKVRNKIKTMPSRYECDGDSDDCNGDRRAHTLTLARAAVKFCSPYLEMSVARKTAVLVHEIAHNFGPLDLAYDRTKIKDVEWWNNAETYEWWFEEGRFCIPGYDCNP